MELKFQWAGGTLLFPPSPLNLSMAGIPSSDQIDAMVIVIHSAMVRNYPDLSLADVEELLDLSNLQTTFLSVMAASGLQKKSGEVESPQN